MVQTLLAESPARDIAAAIEDGKGVAVLENASSVGHPSLTHCRPDIALSNGSYIHVLGLPRCPSSGCATLR